MHPADASAVHTGASQRAPLNRMRDWIAHSWRSLGFTVLIVLMGTTIVALTRQVRAMQPQVDELHRRTFFPVVGHSVPTVQLTSADGDTLTVGETRPGRAQVLFFLSASCRHCEATVPTWRTMAQLLRADSAGRFDVIGISYSPSDSTRAYVRSHDLPFPVVQMDDIKTRRLFRVKAVPMTLVLDHQGQLTYVRPGRFESGAALDSLRAATIARPRSPVQRVAPAGPTASASIVDGTARAGAPQDPDVW